MSHDGPAGSSTCDDKEERGEEGIIRFGSHYLKKFLETNKGKVLCNIHGHCHEGSFLDKVGNLRIINPGSLMFGEFGVIELIEAAGGRWHISQANKHYLI